MSTLQIILVSIAGLFAAASVVFMIMFVLGLVITKKEDKEEVEVKSIFSSEEFINKQENSQDVNSMLAKLDEQAAATEKPAEIRPVEINVQVNTQINSDEKKSVEEVQEVKPIELEEESNATAKIEEVVEEKKDEPATIEEKEIEELSVEKVEEAVEVLPENQEPATEIVKVDEQVAEDGEMISLEDLPDYKARLDKIVENRDKINKDLIKVEKSILNYERTKRRKLRNQKMLDRRASELTNLNLVMYSVTDIKNVDEDKKVKQEELTSHIAELKASIQDADEFLDSNKEKNDHDVKMAKFLIQEKARYNEEIAELQKLIAKTEGSVA